MSDKKLRLTLAKSISGRIPVHTATIAALGLKRLNQVIEVKDNAAMRGMITQVAYLLKVEEIEQHAS
ncbi:50S ribosomal protein L30 [Rickettsiella endosymbiont of Dermanyssus gallinae]|uniref:50S ribosomal protein L30 n=1 Tax=Rickettsiella endosymbiont of Dermanyssus gallinae TaxID=2856608 RepID=UPI001C52C5B5|nr:50S ribosomal protein L30 [Rickettsiella endosymbiont of Dermanyssus gallinae]